MLVLTRRLNETVVIQTAEGDVEVTLLEAHGSKGRIGFSAPPTIKVLRKELVDRQPAVREAA